MAEFLSESWIADLDRAARDAPSLAGVGLSAPLVVEQRVHGGVDDVVYHFTFTSEGARVQPGPAESPDVVLVTDVTTARALQLGTVSAHQAAAAGRLKVRGHVRRLRAATEALRSLDDVFHTVREATTYPAQSEVHESRR